jgi:hypothetical protein
MRCTAARMFRVSALIAVLLIAQTAAMIHSDREDSHPGNEVCALCVGLASLGAGNAAAPYHFEVAIAATVPVDYLLVHAVVPRIERPHARGPPLAS